MNQQVTQPDLHQKTQQLLEGPLKHIKAAALAAALLPLASVAAAPAAAQDCSSAGVCNPVPVSGIVFHDANGDGIYQEGESGLNDVLVVVSDGSETYTGLDGMFLVYVEDGQEATIAVHIPTGGEPSPSNDGENGSAGMPNGTAYSVATIMVEGTEVDGVVVGPTIYFGFVFPEVAQPGTGTPGYWKNHPDAWPVEELSVGGIWYSKTEAIDWLKKVSKDKTTTMFSSLVPAMLNVWIGNDERCVSATIAAANAWMAYYGPVGSGVPASSAAWLKGEPLHMTLDSYNNGRDCAPHRE